MQDLLDALVAAECSGRELARAAQDRDARRARGDERVQHAERCRLEATWELEMRILFSGLEAIRRGIFRSSGYSRSLSDIALRGCAGYTIVVIRSHSIREPGLRRAALDLYGRVWPQLPAAIARASRWGSEWFDRSTATYLCEGDRMLAHVGQVWCDWIVDGGGTRVAALHCVLVDPEHQGRGLGRAVIEAALAGLDAQGVERVILWSEKVAFYERFGFGPVREHAFRCSVPACEPTTSRVLDLDDGADVAELQRLLCTRSSVSQRYAAADDGWHFWIDCAIDPPELGNLRYLPNWDAAVIAEVQDSTTLRIADVVGPELPDLAAIAGAFELGPEVDTIELLFSPDRLAPHAVAVSHPYDDVLQVRGRDLRTSPEEAFALSPFTRT